VLRGQSLRDLARIDRPRERLRRQGPSALSDVELIAAILGAGSAQRGVLEMASDLVRHWGPSLPRASLDELQELPGLGPAQAARLAACFELGRRLADHGRRALLHPEDVLPYVSHIVGKKQEHFMCLSLTGADEVIEARVVSVGLLDAALVHPREVFADPIVDRAAAVILAHNHPSGRAEPSSEDLALTRQLSEAGRLLGIPVRDHIIVTRQGLVSLRALGHL